MSLLDSIITNENIYLLITLIFIIVSVTLSFLFLKIIVNRIVKLEHIDKKKKN
jgi:hypothetical protein